MTQDEAIARLIIAEESGDSEALYALSDECCAIAFAHGGCNTDTGRAWQAIMNDASRAAELIEENA